MMRVLITDPDLLKSYAPGGSEPDGEGDQRVPHFGAHHADLASSSKAGDPDLNQQAAGHMRAGDAEALKGLLRRADPDARDHILDHIHPDHWEGLGFRPVDKETATAEFQGKFGNKGGDTPPLKGGKKSPLKGGNPPRVKGGSSSPAKDGAAA